jgi:hypothetical protein
VGCAVLGGGGGGWGGVGYFVEVLWGLEKRIWDASEEKTNAMRCGAQVESERAERHKKRV